MSESQNRHERQAEEGEDSASKRLKSSEPDLSIVCRFEGKEERIKVHSIIMAHHSNYFDSLLASGMQEAENKTVTLDDVDPKRFRSAIEILEDPNSVLTVSVEDLMAVVPLYNRFEFKNGLKLAETVIGKFIEDWTKAEDKSPNLSEHKLIGDAILLSHQANLENLTEKSISFVKAKFKKGTGANDRAIFDQTFIQKIAPFLEEHRAACLTELYSRLDPDRFEQKLQAVDLLVDLQWWVFSSLALSQFKPLGLKLEGRLALGRNQSPINIRVGLYRKAIGGRLEDGSEIRCNAGRISNALDMVACGKKVEIGDWAVKIGDIDKGISYTFVCPRSKSFPLPPVGRKWILVKRGREDRDSESQPEQTFELVSIQAS